MECGFNANAGAVAAAGVCHRSSAIATTAEQPTTQRNQSFFLRRPERDDTACVWQWRL